MRNLTGFFGIIAIIFLIAIMTFVILTYVETKKIDCYTENEKVENTLQTIINQEKIDSGLVAVQILVLNDNCTEIDTTIIIDCNEECEEEIVKETKEEEAVILEEIIEKKESTTTEDEIIEKTDEVIQETIVEIETVEEAVEETPVDSCVQEALEMNMLVEETKDSTEVVVADTSTLQANSCTGFEKKTLFVPKSYIDRFGVQTTLNMDFRLDGKLATFSLTENKANGTSTLVQEQKVNLAELTNPGIDDYTFSYKHDFLTGKPTLYDTKKDGIRQVAIGAGGLSLAYLSEVCLRFQRDAIMQDYNSIGTGNSDNPYFVWNDDELNRNFGLTLWQGGNHVLAALSVIQVVRGAVNIHRHGTIIPGEFVITPNSLHYYLNIKSY